MNDTITYSFIVILVTHYLICQRQWRVSVWASWAAIGGGRTYLFPCSTLLKRVGILASSTSTLNLTLSDEGSSWAEIQCWLFRSAPVNYLRDTFAWERAPPRPATYSSLLDSAVLRDLVGRSTPPSVSSSEYLKLPHTLSRLFVYSTWVGIEFVTIDQAGEARQRWKVIEFDLFSFRSLPHHNSLTVFLRVLCYY